MKKELTLDELEANAIEDAWIMPSVTETERHERALQIDNVSFWLEHRLEFETDEFIFV